MSEETQLLTLGEVSDLPVETVQRHGHKVINISGDTVVLNTGHLPDDQRELVRWFYGWMKDKKLSWKEVERESGFDSSTLTRIFADTYRYPSDTLKGDKRVPHPRAGERVDLSSFCERVLTFKKLCDERESTASVGFVETSVFKRIHHICQEALVMQCVAFVYGESQIGKTVSLKEVNRRINHGTSKYVLTPAAGGKYELMRAIGEACNIGARTSTAQLRERVENYFGPTNLLILDEVHELMLSYQTTAMAKCLGMIRQLQEKSGMGLVLCGTNAWRDEIEAGNFAQQLKQLRKRGILELQLEDYPTKADLALIARTYELDEPKGDAADHVKFIAKEHGFGKYCKFLKRASQLAAKKHERMSWDHFVKIVAVAAKLKEKAQ